MGVDETWIINALQGILPEQTLQLLHDHVLHPSSTLRTIYAHTLFGMQRLAEFLQPVVQPLAERAVNALQDSPDFVFLGILLAIIFVAFQIMLWVQRTISFFTRLAFRAVLYILIGLVIMAAWQRGPEAVANDVVVVLRKLVGYGAIVKEIWLSEYQKYESQTRAGAGAGGFGGGRGSMGSGRNAGSSGRRW
ncbi:hypothetical protein EV127DRAFT_366153 [Xylaria flabelliformis]|nr:hypothetical protein EV127DRAFT_366153 [Xylaria flabelliformis]KAI0866570.1 hypothetical protein F4860DRAFT_457755 [Xylaria cubensis]